MIIYDYIYEVSMKITVTTLVAMATAREKNHLKYHV